MSAAPYCYVPILRQYLGTRELAPFNPEADSVSFLDVNLHVCGYPANPELQHGSSTHV